MSNRNKRFCLLGIVRRSESALLERKKKVWKFLEKYIEKLLVAPENNMNSMITLSEVREVCLRCRETFRMESTLLRIDPPIYILGDIHGQFPDLVKIISKIGTPPRKRYLFMGDYVDRGQWSLETVSLLMAYKTFNCMPFAALIGERIFAAHGGISEDLLNWNQFERICRPTDITDIGFINDLIWADPGNFPGKYIQSPRGVSQVAQEGFEFLHDRKCLTIFSAPYYCGELNNKAGILYVAESLHCTIYQFRGAKKVGRHGKCDTPQNKEEKPKAKHDELLKKAVSINDKQKENAEKQKKSMEQRKTEFESLNVVIDDEKIFNRKLSENKKKKDSDSAMDEKNKEYDWKTQDE
uniref:protein-serine/threonine phosphatase n=1 Tax=Brugia malayi TaxID=6279 RepID=A0A1P6CD39_BRUMA|nr:Bm9953 [Brugia malayi]